jgi:TRAP-type C4-dicarboxylate transport system substrate-binding protein
MRGRRRGSETREANRSKAAMNARTFPGPAWIVLAAAVAMAMGTVACGQGNLDKAGGLAPKPVILTLADGEIDIANAQPFANAVQHLSHGTLQIKIEGNWRPGNPNYETGLIKDVQAGKAQLGITASAAFDTVGIDRFQALQAPFLINSITLERKVLDSGIPGKMLAGLGRYGLAGLGILPGPLRRPVGLTKPLAAASDYRVARIGIRASRVSEEILRALGATPVVLNRDNGTSGLDGAESHLTNIYIAFAEPYATLTWNVVFEPRPNVIFMNQHAFSALSPADQGVLIRAARQAPAASSVYESDAWSLRTMCLRGITTVTASQADLAGLRAAVRPVYHRLESDPSTKAFINQITAMRQAAGSQPDPLTCPPTGIADQSAADATILGVPGR